MTQIWAVISGVATPERRRKLFRSVDRLLQTDYGARLNDRPFTRPDPSIGSVTFLQQGLNENGAVYVHSNAFLGYANGLAGRGDALYEGLRKQFPCFHDPDITQCEPYALPTYYRPPALPRKYGATFRAWVTTAPSWFLKAVGEGLFGVRAAYDGMEINPSNPRGRGHGVQRITVDGRAIRGRVIPYETGSGTHRVRVVLG
jgi:cellobiose phosphorylase